MKTTKGKQLTLLMNDKSVYHADSHSIQIQPEFETWETKDSDGEKQELTKVRFTGSVNGLICVRETADGDKSHDTSDMIEQAISGSAVTIVTEIAIEGTTPVAYTGEAVIDSFDIEEGVAKKGTYKASFKGCGLKKLTQSPLSVASVKGSKPIV